jgi:formylglycine-generating enzyme required for sulfatase activity
MVSEVDGMVMVYVPEGSFLMGSDEGDGDESPEHEVYLDGFWIDQTEVTNAMYAHCVDYGACERPNPSSSYYGNSSYDEYPVIHVDWYQAQDYCQWAGRRLPTEAEWEKAARGDDGRIYPWGDESPSCNLANYSECAWDTERVGSYAVGASPYGALDMAGNVWEWVADWYDSDYYDNSPSENPTGPSSGEGRVLRSGGWSTNPDLGRASNRNWSIPAGSMMGYGFRCARDSSP